jgi:hypothetical protein
MSDLNTAGDKPLHYVVVAANTLITSGTLPAGDVIATAHALISDSDENALMLALAGVSAPPMPPAGEWLEAGDIYDYGGVLYMVRKSHARTEHDPGLVPSRFTRYREDAGEALDWVAGEQVYVGTQRVYEGVLYTCLQAHQTQGDWFPPAEGILGVLWAVVATTQEWSYPVQYTGDNTAGAGNGDVVTYGGLTYRCLQSHTSQAGWTPPVVPALWLAL